MVSVKAALMKTPWVILSAVKTARSGAKARASVGRASKQRLIETPVRRGRLRLAKASARPAAAMPVGEGVTAKPKAAGGTRQRPRRGGAHARGRAAPGRWAIAGLEAVTRDRMGSHGVGDLRHVVGLDVGGQQHR